MSSNECIINRNEEILPQRVNIHRKNSEISKILARYKSRNNFVGSSK